MKANPVDTIPKFGEQSPAVWINFYKVLKSNFGTKVANSIFIKAWSVRGTPKASSLELREELKKGGVQIDESLWDKVVDTGSGVFDFAGDLFSVGKYTGIALLVIIVGGVGMIIFNIAKAPAQSVGTALKYAK